jgi:ATP-dependent Lon protease
MECKYIFKKGNRKGQACGQTNCLIHDNKIPTPSSTTPSSTTPSSTQISKQTLTSIQASSSILIPVSSSISIPVSSSIVQNEQINEKQELENLVEKKGEIEKSVKKRIINENNIKQKILELDTSIENRTNIMKQFLNNKRLDVNTTEYYKNQIYIDQAMLIPWNKYYNIREQIGFNGNYFTLDDHIRDKIIIKSFIENLKQELDNSIYGMENVKNEIINYVCKFITNPHSQKNNIALHGCAGVCKTKFIKVLSKSLNIPLKIISLGGMKDSSYLLGHSQTYQDSKCGIIIQNIIESKIMNPILYFDELDKVSNSEYGQDIYSVLSNLTDPTINSTFKDRYFSNLSIDLSRAFYVFTFNDILKINKVLLDRLNIIYVENPNKKEKITILKNYCLNDICENIRIPYTINFDDECYKMVIDYTDKHIDSKISSGIRESIRILEKVVLEINKEILLNIFDINQITIYIDKFTKYFNKLKKQFILIESNEPPYHMYV